MGSNIKLKEKIISLRNEGKSFREIGKILNCSKATISYHCRRNNLSDIGLKKYKELTIDEKDKLKEYYNTHTIKETSEKFGISVSTVGRWKKRKRIFLTKEEKKNKNIKLRSRLA